MEYHRLDDASVGIVLSNTEAAVLHVILRETRTTGLDPDPVVAVVHHLWARLEDDDPVQHKAYGYVVGNDNAYKITVKERGK